MDAGSVLQVDRGERAEGRLLGEARDIVALAGQRQLGQIVEAAEVAGREATLLEDARMMLAPRSDARELALERIELEGLDPVAASGLGFVPDRVREGSLGLSGHGRGSFRRPRRA